MTKFSVTVARIADSQMFRREILARNEAAAFRQTTALLSA